MSPQEKDYFSIRIPNVNSWVCVPLSLPHAHFRFDVYVPSLSLRNKLRAIVTGVPDILKRPLLIPGHKSVRTIWCPADVNLIVCIQSTNTPLECELIAASSLLGHPVHHVAGWMSRKISVRGYFYILTLTSPRKDTFPHSFQNDGKMVVDRRCPRLRLVVPRQAPGSSRKSSPFSCSRMFPKYSTGRTAPTAVSTPTIPPAYIT